METNTPYGFEDPGIIYRSSGAANRSEERKFREQFKEFPGTPEDADMVMNVIRKSGKAINNTVECLTSQKQ